MTMQEKFVSRTPFSSEGGMGGRFEPDGVTTQERARIRAELAMFGLCPLVVDAPTGSISGWAAWRAGRGFVQALFVRHPTHWEVRLSNPFSYWESACLIRAVPDGLASDGSVDFAGCGCWQIQTFEAMGAFLRFLYSRFGPPVQDGAAEERRPIGLEVHDFQVGRFLSGSGRAAKVMGREVLPFRRRPDSPPRVAVENLEEAADMAVWLGLDCRAGLFSLDIDAPLLPQEPRSSADAALRRALAKRRAPESVAARANLDRVTIVADEFRRAGLRICFLLSPDEPGGVLPGWSVAFGGGGAVGFCRRAEEALVYFRDPPSAKVCDRLLFTGIAFESDRRVWSVRSAYWWPRAIAIACEAIGAASQPPDPDEASAVLAGIIEQIEDGRHRWHFRRCVRTPL